MNEALLEAKTWKSCCLRCESCWYSSNKHIVCVPTAPHQLFSIQQMILQYFLTRNIVQLFIAIFHQLWAHFMRCKGILYYKTGLWLIQLDCRCSHTEVTMNGKGGLKSDEGVLPQVAVALVDGRIFSKMTKAFPFISRLLFWTKLVSLVITTVSFICFEKSH